MIGRRTGTVDCFCPAVNLCALFIACSSLGDAHNCSDFSHAFHVVICRFFATSLSVKLMLAFPVIEPCCHSTAPRWISQTELNDIVPNLNLKKNRFRLSDFRYNDWNITQIYYALFVPLASNRLLSFLEKSLRFNAVCVDHFMESLSQ
jgi:hypothetical protein